MNHQLQTLLVGLIVLLSTAQALRLLLPRAWRQAGYVAMTRHWPKAHLSWRWVWRLDEASCSNCDSCAPAPRADASAAGQNSSRRVIPIRPAGR